MANLKIESLNKLDDSEKVVRLAFGVADEEKGEKKHFERRGSKKHPEYSLMLSLFELRPNDEDYLSIHRTAVDGWKSKAKGMYALLSVSNIHKVESAEIVTTKINIFDFQKDDISSLKKEKSENYKCIATDFGKSEEDPSHGGIFFYGQNSQETVSYDFIEDGKPEDYDDLMDYPFTNLSNHLLKSVEVFCNSNHEPKDFKLYYE